MALDGTITYVPAVERVRILRTKQQSSNRSPPEDAAATQQYFVDLFTAIATGATLPTFNGGEGHSRRTGPSHSPHIDEQGTSEILGVTRTSAIRKRYEQERASVFARF